jgi:uncharacterized protein
MDNPFLPTPPSAEPSSAVSRPPVSHWILYNERGLRSGWRLAIYIAMFAAAWIGLMLLLSALRPSRNANSPWVLLVGEFLTFAIAFAAAWMMATIEGRSPEVYGLPLRRGMGRLFFLGCIVGLFEVSALMALIAAFGGYSFGQIALHGPSIVNMAISWAVFFIAVGLLEEFLFRGYTQFTLADGIGFWPAAVVLSACFGLVHLRQEGEAWVGAASVFAIGLVFCFALRRTGNLWFCVGLHAAFDYGETFLFSVPNSGVVFQGHLSNAILKNGPVWLTGGTVGPEGSVFSFLTMGLLVLVIHLMFPAKRKTEAPVAVAISAQ